MKRYLLSLLLTAGQVMGAAQKITQLFNVDFSTDSYGGCKYVGETAMNNYLEDSYELAKAGVKLLDDYKDTSNMEAERLVIGYFKGTRRTDRGKLKSNFEAVRDFIEGNKQITGGKPYLYCDSTWLTRFTMQDEWLNEKGQPELRTDEQGLPYYVRNHDVEHMVDKQKESTKALGKMAVPYWSSAHKQYLFDQKYRNVGKGYCSDEGNAGVTQDLILPKAITICSVAFNYKRRLRSVKVTPTTKASIQGSTRPKNAQMIEDTLPSAATLFHELFHLVLGNEESTPASGEEYVWAKMRRLGVDAVSRNPETYVFAAVAYDYTLNSGTKDGHAVEFYAGFAMQG